MLEFITEYYDYNDCGEWVRFAGPNIRARSFQEAEDIIMKTPYWFGKGLEVVRKLECEIPFNEKPLYPLGKIVMWGLETGCKYQDFGLLGICLLN